MRAAFVIACLQMRRKEFIHAPPGVAEHVFPAEVVELAGIHHECDEITLVFLQRFVHEPH